MRNPELLRDVVCGSPLPIVIAKQRLGVGGTTYLTDVVRAINDAHRFPRRIVVESDVPVDPALQEALHAGGTVAHYRVPSTELAAWDPNGPLPAWLADATGPDVLLVWDDLPPSRAPTVVRALLAAGVHAVMVTYSRNVSVLPTLVVSMSREDWVPAMPTPVGT